MEIQKLELKDGTVIEGNIKSPSWMGYNTNLGKFFGILDDNKVKMAINESEIVKIYYY